MKTPKFIQNIIDKIKDARLKAANRMHDIEYQKQLIDEFNLIQQKQSKLSKSERQKVEDRMSYLVRNGIIKIKR